MLLEKSEKSMNTNEIILIAVLIFMIVVLIAIVRSRAGSSVTAYLEILGQRLKLNNRRSSTTLFKARDSKAEGVRQSSTTNSNALIDLDNSEVMDLEQTVTKDESH